MEPQRAGREGALNALAWFIVGAFAGAPVGLLVTALMMAAKTADLEMERDTYLRALMKAAPERFDGPEWSELPARMFESASRN